MFDLSDYCANLERLVNVDSGSDNPRGVNIVADFFEKLFSDIGWRVERHHIDEAAGDCLKICNRDCDHYDLMMIGHMDTVFPVGTASKRPFRIEGNLAFGPGVSDMKSGILAMYYIVRELRASVLDRLSVCIVMNPDEEIGSVYSRPLIDGIARRSDYAFVLEGTALEGHVYHRPKRVGQIRNTVLRNRGTLGVYTRADERLRGQRNGILDTGIERSDRSCLDDVGKRRPCFRRNCRQQRPRFSQDPGRLPLPGRKRFAAD